MKLYFSRQIFENTQHLMRIRPVVDELFHADGRTVRQDKANVAFRNLAKAPMKIFQFTALFYGCQLILSWYK
jgi:hypothetical protein